jgi:predicted metal-dependent hydrolase
MRKNSIGGAQLELFQNAEAPGIPDPDGLQKFCRSVLQASFPAFREATVEACFYPYVGLTHTLRRKKNGWLLRISDHCRTAPAHVIEAVTLILACRVMRRKPPRKAIETYALFSKNPVVEADVRRRRLRKGRKQISCEAGRYHSLKSVYDALNTRYFNNQIEISRIGWGLRRSWSRLGHYDPVHHTIALSPVLDSPRVPSYVLRYIVYHEMLHAVFEEALSGGSRRHHTREYRRAEKSYPDYEKANKFLENFTRRRGRV